jgi:transcription antitermination factor NusG
MGILGSSGKNTPPTPVSEDEIEAILNIKTDSEGVIVNQDDGSQNKIISTEDSVIFEKIHIKSPFLVDQIVYIKQGNFKDEQAKVISFNETTGKALISYDF